MSDTLDTVFAALADPTRRAILSMLLEDEGFQIKTYNDGASAL